MASAVACRFVVIGVISVVASWDARWLDGRVMRVMIDSWLGGLTPSKTEPVWASVCTLHDVLQFVVICARRSWRVSQR